MPDQVRHDETGNVGNLIRIQKENFMLSADIIKKIKKVHIKTGRVVNTLMAGQYKSVFRGAGIEFEEVREYAPATT
jgi:L-ribulose-5-phosphate 3-epimerase UlaE